jgi:Protein of unknown function (DUF2961)
VRRPPVSDAPDVRSDGYGGFGSSLRDLPRLRHARSLRESSWDRTGGNRDWATVEPGQTLTLARLTGPGCINHIWMTFQNSMTPALEDGEEPDWLRKTVLRIRWDGEEEPSVLVPVGDFFGAFSPAPREFTSAPLQVGPDGARSLNSYWHMPFASSATIELQSELTTDDVGVYFAIDYQQHSQLESDIGRFHCQWRRENPCEGISDAGLDNQDFLFGGTNLTGEGNYTILEAEGWGHYVGCILSVRNLRESPKWDWYGEGDDMIFIDGEPFPPSLHGTGTEDYFNTAWCPAQAYSAPYHGITLPGGPNWSGEISLYRFHIEDPVTFERSIRVTIEHGHANKRSDDYSSVAYWYQTLPHRPFGGVA